MQLSERKRICPCCKKKLDGAEVGTQIINNDGEVIAIIRGVADVKGLRFVCVECLKERGESI